MTGDVPVWPDNMALMAAKGGCLQLYGACEETYRRVTGVKGGFDKVIKNCMKIKKAGINLSLRSPIIKETEKQMRAMERIAEELKVPFICTFELCPTIDRDNSPQNHQVSVSTMLKYEFENYYKQIKNDERDDVITPQNIIESMKNNYIFSCNVGMNSFVIDYKGKMCPCMKLKHHGIKILDNDFDTIWEHFEIYSKMKSSESYRCSKCDSRYYCDICPAEMEFMFGDYEYRAPYMCVLAKFRKEFYRKEKLYDEIFKEANKGNNLELNF